MSNFWNDLAIDLKNPAFRRVFIIESIKIEILDWLMNLHSCTGVGCTWPDEHCGLVHKDFWPKE